MPLKKNNDKEKQKIIPLILSIIIYLLYLELNPKITGIWLRRDSENCLRITFNGLWKFIKYPFQNIKMWYPNLWDMNVFISIPLLFYIFNI
jgi:hypothetical protein